jgi:hypothetical protein
MPSFGGHMEADLVRVESQAVAISGPLVLALVAGTGW